MLIDQRIAPLMGISDQENEELTADASTFTTCFNYLLTTWHWAEDFRKGAGKSRKRPMDKRQRYLMAWKSAIRATEICDAYYSAVLLLANLTQRGGDENTARRLHTTGMRLPYVQQTVQNVRQEILVARLRTVHVDRT